MEILDGAGARPSGLLDEARLSKNFVDSWDRTSVYQEIEIVLVSKGRIRTVFRGQGKSLQDSVRDFCILEESDKWPEFFRHSKQPYAVFLKVIIEAPTEGFGNSTFRLPKPDPGPPIESQPAPPQPA